MGRQDLTTQHAGRLLALAVGIGIAMLFITGCQGENSSPGAETVEVARIGPERSLTIDIEGMHCQACVNAVTDRVGGINGVKAIEVVLETGKAHITAVESVPDDEVIEAIEKLGYTAAIGTEAPDDAQTEESSVEAQ